ncbi:MAG: hypothetical protein ACKOQ3_05595, partial [Novosphingobium sp.]
LSGYVVLIASVALALLICGNVLLKLIRGEPVELNRDGINVTIGLAVVIPAAVKFVRSHHAR